MPLGNLIFFFKLAYLSSKLRFSGKYLFYEHQISAGQLSADSSSTETLYCLNSARPRKMPGWRVPVRGKCPYIWIEPVRENFSVNKRVCRKQTIEILLRRFCLFSFSNFTFGFHGLHLKEFKIIQLSFELARGRKFSGEH